MATRSTIGYFDSTTNMFHYVYCHSDGYIYYNGRILRDYYNTLEIVKELVSLISGKVHGSYLILNVILSSDCLD